MKIQDKIRLLRESQSISQESIANELNISQKSYSRIENGVTSLKVFDLERIAKVLKTDPGRLLDADEVVTKIKKQVTENVYGVQNGTIQKYYPPENMKNLKKRVEKIEKEIERLKKLTLARED